MVSYETRVKNTQKHTLPNIGQVTKSIIFIFLVKNYHLKFLPYMASNIIKIILYCI